MASEPGTRTASGRAWPTGAGGAAGSHRDRFQARPRPEVRRPGAGESFRLPGTEFKLSVTVTMPARPSAGGQEPGTGNASR
jgi:hypothetical protein